MYIQQRAEELVYSLLVGAAPRNLVKVLVERRVELPGGEVTLAIIGSSHFLEIRTDDSVVTEVLAAERPGLEALSTFARANCGSRRFGEALPGGTEYRFEMQSLRYTLRDFETESARLCAPAANRLCFRFPASGEVLPGLTCLEWETAGSRLTVDTYHTYPGELTIVRSRSLVEFPEKGRTQ